MFRKMWVNQEGQNFYPSIEAIRGVRCQTHSRYDHLGYPAYGVGQQCARCHYAHSRCAHSRLPVGWVLAGVAAVILRLPHMVSIWLRRY